MKTKDEWTDREIEREGKKQIGKQIDRKISRQILVDIQGVPRLIADVDFELQTNG